MTGFWIFMLIMCLLIPVIMITAGRNFLKGGPRKISRYSGYRTSRSMKNMDTWRFAHQYCGKILFTAGLIMLPVSALAMLFFYDKDIDAVSFAGFVIVMIQIGVMLLAIFFTEAALKKNFDADGRRR